MPGVGSWAAVLLKTPGGTVRLPFNTLRKCGHPHRRPSATNGPEQLQQILPARPAPLRVKHITIHHIVAGCCFRIGKGDNPLPARINSGIDYMKRCECITILGGVAGRGKGATGGSVGDRAHPNLARATAYYRRWPTSRPCLLAFRFTAATVLLIDLAIVVTGVFLREWLFNSRKSSFVHLRTGRPSDRRSVLAFRFTAATVRFIDFATVVAGGFCRA
jgi:hypothetical protein